MAAYQPFPNTRLEVQEIQGLVAVAKYPPSSNTLYPAHHRNSSSTSTLTFVNQKGDEEVQTREIIRTPSPTPSEAAHLKKGAIDWKAISKPRFWWRREWLWYYVALLVTVVIVALITIYHKEIVTWLTPATQWLQRLKFGWLVPIAVLFVISFPPLFGHEIVAVLCGLVWGLWIGFGIVAAGTLLGEIGNFYAFKWCLRSRGEKLERTNMSYSCLARIVRDGGFKIALVARLSAIPGHFTTAVFSACGMGIFTFIIAAVLSMPKQFITVYLGVVLHESNQGIKDKRSRIISNVVLALTLLITVVAMWYMLRQMDKVKPQIIYERRKARQAKLFQQPGAPVLKRKDTENSDVFNPSSSDLDDIPLTGYQRWDQNGKAVDREDREDVEIVVPTPRRAPAVFLPNYPRDEEEAGGYLKPAQDDGTDEAGWDSGKTPTRLHFHSNGWVESESSRGHATFREEHSTSPVNEDGSQTPRYERRSSLKG